MSIPKNITKTHVERAINEIQESKIPKERLSYNYFLVEKGKKLPPKYVICIANKYANNVELAGNEFNAVQAQSFLKKLGFNIVDKSRVSERTERKCWIEKTIVKGRPDRQSGERALGKSLWSPQKDKRGADIYKNMRKVSKGDIVVHLVDNKEILGVSIVEEEAVEATGVKGTDWEGPAYWIRLKDYETLEPKISRNEILNNTNRELLDSISADSEVFYNIKLNLREGAYLTPCPPGLYSLINQTYKNKTGKNLPHFDVRMFNSPELNQENSLIKEDFQILGIINNLKNANLKFEGKLTKRFCASILTKPFVILSGLSGSGKTKLAQAFVQWICADEDQYRIVPVGADWTNREPLLGYPNALNNEEYIKPENGVVDLIIHAHNNKDFPHFLILDEMNLSHVERYFADFLSVMESNGKITFHSGKEKKSGVHSSIPMPDNLFIIGTINVDETTYMFSPKVLDRANVIEFRITEKEIGEFLENPLSPDLEQLKGAGAGMAESFLEMARTKEFNRQTNDKLNKTLVKFFGELKKNGAEFGYRSAYEIHRLIHQLLVIDNGLNEDEILDVAIMQKLLPKLHGSRRKLCPILTTLGNFCIEADKFDKIEDTILLADDFDFEQEGIKYSISLEKIARMYKGAIDNGFASYAEA